MESLPDPYGADLLAALLRLHGRQALGELGVERLHPLLGPHQSLGPLGLVQLDGTGVVDADDLLPDGIAQHGAQRGPDPLLRRRSSDLLASHGGAHRWVFRRACLQDGLVLLVDASEHLLQDRHPQPVHPDVSENLFQVLLVMRSVAPERGLANVAAPLVLRHTALEEVAEQHGAELLAAVVLAAQFVVVR
ncbi:hypothetical protein ABZ897_52805 [Nonomuraea sp. NPDC046802]|uniref:hypothetical protein n=1 Tax=Nonomuraea sp. NPDC046802 TaxID=3154919 RepID=UPI0034070A0E